MLPKKLRKVAFLRGKFFFFGGFEGKQHRDAFCWRPLISRWTPWAFGMSQHTPNIFSPGRNASNSGRLQGLRPCEGCLGAPPENGGFPLGFPSKPETWGIPTENKTSPKRKAVSIPSNCDASLGDRQLVVGVLSGQVVPGPGIGDQESAT